MTEDGVRRIVREELARNKVSVKCDAGVATDRFVKAILAAASNQNDRRGKLGA